MEQNVGMADRIIRIILGVVFIILALTHSYWWFIPAVLALATGIVGWCFVYALFGWSTVPATKPVKVVKPLKKSGKKRK